MKTPLSQKRSSATAECRREHQRSRRNQFAMIALLGASATLAGCGPVKSTANQLSGPEADCSNTQGGQPPARPVHDTSRMAAAVDALEGPEGSSGSETYSAALDILWAAKESWELEYLAGQMFDERPSDKVESVVGQYTVGMRVQRVVLRILGCAREGYLLHEPDYAYVPRKLQAWMAKHDYDLERMRAQYALDRKVPKKEE
ncbi:MAG: hypothetical protein IT463_01740 [Planctomycetes bacterium]|nr:hypothetical protein [Planctomycetota bacterium]